MHAEDTASTCRQAGRRPTPRGKASGAEASSAIRRGPRRRLRIATAALVAAATAIVAIEGQTVSSSAQAVPTTTTAVPTAAQPPETIPTARPPRVAYVGDSIGHSAEAEVRRSLARGYRLTSYDSVDGSTITEHLASVTALLRSRAVPDLLVVELGTNDAEHHGAARFERDLRTMLDLVSPRVREIRWLDQKDTPTYYAGVNRHAVRFNAILRRVVAQYPNVEVVDYAAWARTAPAGSFVADLLHLTPLGRRQLAGIVLQAVDRATAGLRDTVA